MMVPVKEGEASCCAIPGEGPPGFDCGARPGAGRSSGCCAGVGGIGSEGAWPAGWGTGACISEYTMAGTADASAGEGLWGGALFCASPSEVRSIRRTPGRIILDFMCPPMIACTSESRLDVPPARSLKKGLVPGLQDTRAIHLGAVQ